ncbi:MAG: chloride channel protein [Planctomycetota bacterium]|nr:chloride channel protein [Planctomycetota bacterium]
MAAGKTSRGYGKLLGILGLGNLGYAGKWVLLAGLIGVVAGLAAIGFSWLIRFVADNAFAGPAPVEGESAGLVWWQSLLILGIPAAGGFLARWLTDRFAPEAVGHGTEQMIRSFHEKDGKVRPRVILIKGLASAVTIGTGGSAGQEGPIAQIGSGVGSGVSDAFHFPDRDRRMFLLAGASAGIGAIFSAPLGGALFAPEVLYRKPEFEGEAIIPCIIASIVAYTTRQTLTPGEHAVPIPADILEALEFDDWRQLLIYLVLALVCTFVGLIYTRTFSFVHRSFEALPKLTRPLKAALGGLLLGGLALAIAPVAGGHGVLFGGYGLMQGSIVGEIGIGVLLLLIAAKILATSLTLGSGGSGGLFAPSLAIGALTGAAVGSIAAKLFPDLGLEPACFAFVGMGGFFSGVAKTPIASIIIVCEMTGSYALLAPLMLVSVLHMLLATGWSIYDTQVPSQVDSPAHAGDFVVDVLERMKVKDVLEGAREPVVVAENTTLRRALEIVSKSRSTYFPVVDKDEQLVGIFGLTDIRRIFREEGIADLVIVRDFMVEDVVTITLEEDLSVANQRLNDRGIAQIPVVDADNPRRVLGMLSRNNLGAAYHQRLRQLKRAGSAD